MHRAVTNARKERISLAMFHGLDPDEEIEPAPAALKREPAGAVQDSSEGQGVPAGQVL